MNRELVFDTIVILALYGYAKVAHRAWREHRAARRSTQRWTWYDGR